MNYLVALAVLITSAISAAPLLAPMPRPAPPAAATSTASPLQQQAPMLVYPMPAGSPAETVSAASPASPVAPPACNVDACAAVYRTFRESDCSYVPSAGQRKLCTK